MDLGTLREGVLVIGVDASAPGPFHSGVPGTPYFKGFDVDLTSEIARLLGLVPQFCEFLWSSIFQAINRHHFDLVCTACTITEERKKLVDFSDPYFDTELALIARRSSNIHNLEEPRVQRIAVRIATVAEEAVRARVGTRTIRTYHFNEEVYGALAAGEVDAVVDDALIAAYFVQARREIGIVGPVPGTHLQYGLVLAKGNERLRFGVNRALATIKANGTYERIYSQWFGEVVEVS